MLERHIRLGPGRASAHSAILGDGLKVCWISGVAGLAGLSTLLQCLLLYSSTRAFLVALVDAFQMASLLEEEAEFEARVLVGAFAITYACE